MSLHHQNKPAPAQDEREFNTSDDDLTEQQPVCWASSTALAKLRNGRNNSPCVLTDGPAEFNDTPLYAAPIAQTAPHPEQSERWQSVTRPGQIDVGDWLSFTVGGCLICAKARDVLNPGTDREEVIYNRAKNYYFITRMAVDGSSSHKGVMRAAPCAHVGDT